MTLKSCPKASIHCQLSLEHVCLRLEQQLQRCRMSIRSRVVQRSLASVICHIGSPWLLQQLFQCNCIVLTRCRDELFVLLFIRRPKVQNHQLNFDRRAKTVPSGISDPYLSHLQADGMPKSARWWPRSIAKLVYNSNNYGL